MNNWPFAGAVFVITGLALVLLWSRVRIWSERRFFSRVAAEFTLPVLIFDGRGRLRFISPGLLIFAKKPPVSILTQGALVAQLSHPHKQIEIDSIIYRCELNPLTDKKRGAYCVAVLEFSHRKS